VKVETLEKELRSILRENLLSFCTGRRNRVFVKVKNGYHRDVIRMFLKGGAHLSVISSVDLGEELEMVYHFEIKPLQVVLKTGAPKANPKIETISDMYPSAAWYEREAMEMMGINIIHHPDPRHLFLPDDYTAFPLRRY
jgi:Ni,Fe-hydrogenase III component G